MRANLDQCKPAPSLCIISCPTDGSAGGRGPTSNSDWKIEMNSIIWLVGAVVIVVVILGFLGLR